MILAKCTNKQNKNMGTKIKFMYKSISIIITLFATNLTFAQNYSTYDYAKLYTLKRCLDVNYLALDSSFTKKIPDITSSLVLQSLSPEQMNKIDKVVKKNASDYYRTPPYGSYDNPNANQICFFCWMLYESKSLRKKLKKILKTKE